MNEDKANRIKEHLREIFANYGFHHTNFQSITSKAQCHTDLTHETVSLWMQGLIPSSSGYAIADQV